MLVVFLFCVFTSMVLYAHGANGDAEYCKRYPGEIAFSYTTTQDEYYWFQNYQNAYNGVSKKGDWKIYRRRTIITRHPRPHGYHPGLYNNMNEPNMINQFQQVQVQQQVQQQAPIPNTDSSAERGTNETEEEEKPALPIWKITIPRQTSRAILARIENAQVVDHFELNSTHFTNPNITTSTSHSVGNSNSAPSATTRIIDITDQSIITDAWYAICLDVNVVENGKPHICNHCTLLQARTDSGRQRFLDFDWETVSFQNDSAEGRYSATDIPFPWATIKTKVLTTPPHQRCRAEPQKVVYESKDYAYPDHYTYVQVKNLVGKMAYDVQVDLEFPWKQEPTDILPKPFVAKNYLHSETGTALAICDDFSYTGE